MKKVLALILVSMMALSMVACGEEAPAPEKEAPAMSQEAPEEEPAEEPAENAEFKETLDTCESTINDCVDFMKKYENADETDAVAMLADYTEILEKLEDATSKLDEIDESKLTGEDLEYYIEVTDRINEKLASVSE